MDRSAQHLCFRDKVEKLAKKIAAHKLLYYEGKSSIADEQYDRLEEQLRALDAGHEELTRVGTQQHHLKKKVQHSSKMLSLDKVYLIDDLYSWIGTHEVISTLKIDGVSCSLLYREGALALAKTRGDGLFGEDVTSCARWVEDIPKKFDKFTDNFEVRGELYCTKKGFEELKVVMKRLNLSVPRSQRNIIAGILLRKKHIHLARFMHFKAFDLLEENDHILTEMDKFMILKERSFQTPDVELHKDLSSIKPVIDSGKTFDKRESFQVDGLVFSYNLLAVQKKYGVTAHHPKFKMAFKYRGSSKTTKIEEIQWSISRKGYLTPVASIEPVYLSHAMIRRVTLHNFKLVKDHRLKRGDTIEIIRSGEVIPKFVSLIKSSQGTFIYPQTCPFCQGKTSIETIRLICTMDTCKGRVKQILLNFIQKIGIEGLDERRLEEMMEKCHLKNIPQLYTLSKKDFLKLDKVQETMAAKLFLNIQKTKNVDLLLFLTALGIDQGSSARCEKILRAGFNTLEKIDELDEKKLKNIPGFATTISHLWITSFRSKKEIIDGLLHLNFCIEPFSISPERMQVCITGPLVEKRSLVIKRFKELGIIVNGTLTNTTNYLIINTETSKSLKFKRAIELNIPRITESAFYHLIEHSK